MVGKNGLRLWLPIGLVLIIAIVAGVLLWPRSSSPTGGAAQPALSQSPRPVPSLSGGEQQSVDSCVAALLSKLSPQQRAGQVLMIGTPVNNPQGIASAISTYGLGGIFLAGRSTQSAATHKQAIQSLQQRAVNAVGIPLQVAVDQEGGSVQTLRGTDFPPIPSAVTQGTWDAATLRSQTGEWADRVAAAAVTMDLAPVADTVPAGTASKNPPIGAFSRQFGSDPSRVAQSVATVTSAMQHSGLLATLKHFPGLGRVRVNTDTSTGAVDNVTTADDPYLQPFASGIDAGAAVVMISSATYPKLDANNIAAFSEPIVTGLLRQKLKFTGLVISDDLGAAVAVQGTPVGQRAVRFISAGGDMALTVRSSDAKPMADALVQAASSSPQFQARLTDAARHVLLSKVRAGLLTCPR